MPPARSRSEVEKETGDANSSAAFRDATAVHIVARGRDEASGPCCGAAIAFEADAKRTDDADGARTIPAGSFGELRLRDHDGAA